MEECEGLSEAGVGWRGGTRRRFGSMGQLEETARDPKVCGREEVGVRFDRCMLRLCGG